MSNPMTSLVLDEGMSVELRGQLALCEDEVVLTGCGVLPFGSPPHLTWEQTPFVALATDCAKKARPLVGQPVFGRATWTGYEISACELEPGDAWAHAHDIPGPLTKDRTPVSAHVRSVEAGLFSSGAMLRRVRFLDDGRPRVIASATDVELTTRLLTPIYGDALEVHRSRWSVSEVRGLDDILNGLPEDKVLKIEYRMDGDGTISRKLRVNYVDDDLARSLAPFPPEMLAVYAVVEPEGAPQDRDPWFPARARHLVRSAGTPDVPAREHARV